MQYKTIVLHLLEQRPLTHERLRNERLLLPALDHYATALKTSHRAWTDRLRQARPGSSETQVASEALEIALRELEDRMPPDSPADAEGQVSLDEAMAFIRRHTSHR